MKQINNIRKNSMGTTDFDGQFKGMRKPQDFIVYPIKASDSKIIIQSDNRFGAIDPATGKGVLSASKKDANSIWLMVCLNRKTALPIELSMEDLANLIAAIKSTGSNELVGDSVKVDNSGALSL